jgi:hypothetical protein
MAMSPHELRMRVKDLGFELSDNVSETLTTILVSSRYFQDANFEHRLPLRLGLEQNGDLLRVFGPPLHDNGCPHWDDVLQGALRLQEHFFAVRFLPFGSRRTLLPMFDFPFISSNGVISDTAMKTAINWSSRVIDGAHACLEHVRNTGVYDPSFLNQDPPGLEPLKKKLDELNSQAAEVKGEMNAMRRSTSKSAHVLPELI